MKKVRINRVRDDVFAFIISDPRLQMLEEFLRIGAQIYVVGGAVRDAIASDMAQFQVAPRDFDIAVANVRREAFDEVLQSFGRQNRHGGYVLTVRGMPNWDVWRLEESIGLKKTGAACSLETVLRTFNLDCNAIALDFRTGLFLHAGTIEAIRHRRVGLVAGAIHHSHDTFAAKALLLNLRLNYQLAGDLRSFVALHLDDAGLLHEAQKVFPQLAVLSAPSRS